MRFIPRRGAGQIYLQSPDVKWPSIPKLVYCIPHELRHMPRRAEYRLEYISADPRIETVVLVFTAVGSEEK